jgi:hypothetical protein
MKADSSGPDRAMIDPYAPPQAALASARTTNRAWLKWLYASIAGARLAAAVPLYSGLIRTARYVAVADGLTRLLGLAGGIAWLVWLHAAFSDVRDQLTACKKPIETTPGSAVGRYFIPFYNLYWAFAVHIRLVRALRSLGRGRRALSIVVIAALTTAVFIVFAVYKAGPWPFFVSLATPVPWTAYMVLVDDARSVRIRRRKSDAPAYQFLGGA